MWWSATPITVEQHAATCPRAKCRVQGNKLQRGAGVDAIRRGRGRECFCDARRERPDGWVTGVSSLRWPGMRPLSSEKHVARKGRSSRWQERVLRTGKQLTRDGESDGLD